MFWRFGGYANISAIDTILDKPEFALEELLDESDLIQELKQHNSKLLDYLRKRDVLARLLEYVVAPTLEPVALPDEEEEHANREKGKSRVLPFGRSRALSQTTDDGNEEGEAEKKRNKYAFVACEVLSSDNWTICEALMEISNRDLLFKFWEFLKLSAPLDPLQASYFTKVNESLFDKKTEEMIDFLKQVDKAIPNMLLHVDCPMVMDLLIKIISLERSEHGQGIVEWLYTQDLMPSLLSFLDPKHSWATQTSAGDFMKAIITVSANASQNEQTCIGPNELTRQLVSKPCIAQLIEYMLGGGNALTVGVGIVIEVIRKNNSDYDPDVGAEPNAVPSSRDPIYLGTLLRMFGESIPRFKKLVLHPAQRERLESTFNEKLEPLGFDRFKTCELMAELLHCSNMALLNEPGAEALIAVRDAERQRLRQEGKLTSMRGDEGQDSAEDLTMRMAHSSPLDEGRRLGVTNISDDDGFEEVTHSNDMNEDTSHEFVKAEHEFAPSASTSLFLGKDDDDFVDEPLSSPRLCVQGNASTGTPFEDPDLVVAPLSPSKRRASVSSEAGKGDDDLAATEVSSDKFEGLHIQDDQDQSTDGSLISKVDSEHDTSDDPESQIVFKPTVLSISPPKDTSIAPISQVSSNDSATVTTEVPSATTELSPHPEDLPPPLFSKDKSSTETPASSQNEEMSDADNAAAVMPGDESSGDAAARPVPEVPEVPEAPDAPDAAKEQAIEHVVGDFLKMQFVDHEVVPTILQFFFSYPWNNFLHNVVYDIVQQVFNGPMDRGFNPTLAVSLFEAADVTTQIIKGQAASEESQTQHKTRMGYMGHLTLIAEEVVKFTERHPPELLSESVLDKVMSPDWINYVEGALAETRERDNAILGGVRPEAAMASRAAGGLAGVGLSGLGSALGLGQGSSALADAGLNGGLDLNHGGDMGNTPFSISAGISSGFHSSSDEDDDDAEDNDEDVNQEFRAYTDPLNASSLDPPSIPPPPPPPPPLNIPPSRARLQLAARLAANKRNAASLMGSDKGGASTDDADNESRPMGSLQPAPVVERLRNPFADDEDDDDEDEDDEREGDESGGIRDGWNRGGWWRGMVRSRGNNNPRGGGERFGDGRDSSDSDNAGDDEGDDEEFGDFAMPEEKGGSSEVGSGGLAATSGQQQQQTSGIDKDRERVLLKPLPVHPPAAGGSTITTATATQEGSEISFHGQDKEHREKEGQSQEPEHEQIVLGEDGKQISRAKQATRRTSLDDADEEEVVV